MDAIDNSAEDLDLSFGPQADADSPSCPASEGGGSNQVKLHPLALAQAGAALATPGGGEVQDVRRDLFAQAFESLDMASATATPVGGIPDPRRHSLTAHYRQLAKSLLAAGPAGEALVIAATGGGGSNGAAGSTPLADPAGAATPGAFVIQKGAATAAIDEGDDGIGATSVLKPRLIPPGLDAASLPLSTPDLKKASPAVRAGEAPMFYPQCVHALAFMAGYSGYLPILAIC